MLIFLKLGGSLITDKTRESTFLGERMARLSAAIASAMAARPGLRLLIGHGSGSFGHFAAYRHGTMQGVATAEQWQGFAEVARVAGHLNDLVSEKLAAAGIPVWPLQPSASAECVDGDLRYLEARPLQIALEKGLVPLVYGDVALDTVRGGAIISTEEIFLYLTPILRPRHILLLGEVEGVLDQGGHVIPRITPQILPEIEAVLGGSRGVDVTGGMAGKVREMVRLVQTYPALTIHILSGLEPESVQDALRDPMHAPGTAIFAEQPGVSDR